MPPGSRPRHFPMPGLLSLPPPASVSAPNKLQCIFDGLLRVAWPGALCWAAELGWRIAWAGCLALRCPNFTQNLSQAGNVAYRTRKCRLLLRSPRFNALVSGQWDAVERAWAPTLSRHMLGLPSKAATNN